MRNLVHFLRMFPCCAHKIYVISWVFAVCKYGSSHHLSQSTLLHGAIFSSESTGLTWHLSYLIILSPYFTYLTLRGYFSSFILISHAYDNDRYHCPFPGVLEHISLGFVVSMMVASCWREFTGTSQAVILPSIIRLLSMFTTKYLDSATVSYVTVCPFSFWHEFP